MTVQNLKDEAMRLSPRERADLASELLRSLERDDPGAMWLDEAEQRAQAFDQGRLTEVDALDASARLRAQLP